MKSFTVKGKIWKYPGVGGWHFVYVDKKKSAELKKYKDAKRVAWGYIKVKATVGNTSWNTTLFPTKEGPYLLAIKAIVRRKEGIMEGEMVRVTCMLQ